MDVVIDRLTSKDENRLGQLLDCFAVAFEDRRTYTASRPDRQYTLDLLDDPQIMVLAAIVGDRLVGGLIAYELRKLEQPRSELYVYDLAVAEPFRQQGIATRLISALQPIARETGAWVIYVQADHGDQPAINLYSKLGTREDVLHFDIPVVFRQSE